MGKVPGYDLRCTVVDVNPSLTYGVWLAGWLIDDRVENHNQTNNQSAARDRQSGPS